MATAALTTHWSDEAGNGTVGQAGRHGDTASARLSACDVAPAVAGAAESGRNKGSASVRRLDWLRVMDVVLALALLVMLAPLLVAVALAVRLTSAGPALFSHGRIGRRGQSFPCLKFRTMVVDADARLAALLRCDAEARAEWLRDHKLRSDPRITPVGAFLRRSSLDELPQLFNVLNGTMSLVGPRPIVAGEVVRYGSRFVDYCRVRPGMTGLWQVNGRSNTTYRQRVAMDVLYVKRRSLLFNSLIIAKTIPAVMLQRGSC